MRATKRKRGGRKTKAKEWIAVQYSVFIFHVKKARFLVERGEGKFRLFLVAYGFAFSSFVHTRTHCLCLFAFGSAKHIIRN